MSTGPRLTRDGRLLPKGLRLGELLQMSSVELVTHLEGLDEGPAPNTKILSPADPEHEIWAAGVTYLRSRDERKAESTVADVYDKVYDAKRPELFFKGLGRRSVGHETSIRIRRDSDWNVPEPELTLVLNARGEIVGYTAGNDVSSRSIEGENPLYLPQAKTYTGSCALGPSIVIANVNELRDIPIECTTRRAGATAFRGVANTNQMKRSFEDLVEHLFRELDFPAGGFLMTGTGIVPEYPFTMREGDEVEIRVGELTLVNKVASNG